MARHHYHIEVVSTFTPKKIETPKTSPKIYQKNLIPILLITIVVLGFYIASTLIPKKCSFTPASYCSKLEGDIKNLTSSTTPIFQSLFSSGRFYDESLSKLYTSLTRLDETLSEINGQAKIDPQIHQIVNQLILLSPSFSRLLAVNSQTSYLVLIQDPTELRSSGGYIDTLAYFTLTNTHITSSRFFSSSSLTASSPAPASWQKLTRQTNWQIRDANFNPDFPSGAKEISSLFTRSTSLPVDYVIALDLTTLEKLLDISGLGSQSLIPLYLKQLSQTGSNNLFLSSLVSSLVPRLSQLPPSSQMAVARFLLSRLQSRQIYLYPSIPSWDGSFTPPSCPTTNCFSDFLIPVENHLGPNKSSAFIIRSSSLSQTFSDRLVTYEYRLTLENTSTSSVWPAGTVKNYFQLFLPAATSIDSVNMPYSASRLSGFNLISLQIDIPPGKTQNLIVGYHQPLSQPLSQYLFSHLPQPGLLSLTFTHTLNFPDTWSVVTRQVPAVAQSSQLRYNVQNPNPYILELDINQ
ncbi:MAG: Uncharacterized protein G01um101416_1020 [Microgenomates group bacterium Gr01-1014_16]|nr:MAG: Uncharacterized protein G01um101416_1020 [Microgenomates group bacterium Gr01-1014_16]